MYAYKVYAYDVYVYDVHAYGVHAYDVHAYDVYVYEVHVIDIRKYVRSIFQFTILLEAGPAVRARCVRGEYNTVAS